MLWFNKRGKFWKVFLITLLILIIISLILIVGLLGYYFLTNNKSSSSSGGGTRIENPTNGLSLEEAVAKFDESFVYYLLINIGAYNLKDPPFSSDHPKIKFYIDDDIYNAVIIDRSIRVSRGQILKEDIIIRTSKEEAVKMVQDKNYIKTSFANKGSGIELVASKIKLASKGYLEIYNNLAG